MLEDTELLEKEVDDTVIVETVEDGKPVIETDETTQEDAKEETQEPELVVNLGDDDQEVNESPVISTLRKKHREAQKRIRELEAAQANAVTQTVALGPKPTLENFDYDADKYDAALLVWAEQKRNHDAKVAQEAEEAKARQQSWAANHAAYKQNAASLNVRDFEEVEEAVTSVLSVAQQNLLIHVSERPEYLVLALGRNPEKAKQLAAITDEFKFTAALARLEASMKVTGTKEKPSPEKRLVGKTAATGVNKLDQLRAEAEKTGDYTKVTAYKAELRRLGQT